MNRTVRDECREGVNALDRVHSSNERFEPANIEQKQDVDFNEETQKTKLSFQKLFPVQSEAENNNDSK